MGNVGSIKPKPLIGEILPGFTFLALVLFSYFKAHTDQWDKILTNDHSAVIIAASGLVFILSWIIGDFFDALREALVETIWDLKQPLNWDFFFEGDREKVDQVEDYYYSYYELNINFAVAIVVFLILGGLFYKFDPSFIKPLPGWANFILVGVVIIFFWDATILRCEIKRLIGNGYPHHGVYARLKPSNIHPSGMGVFAIRDIPKGTYVFYGDDDPIVWVSKNKTNKLTAEVKKLYEAFAIIKGNKYGCPKNFNQLTLSWYLNHSKNPNMVCDIEKEYRFYALRDIKKGEELTADYKTYNEAEFDNHGEAL